MVHSTDHTAKVGDLTKVGRTTTPSMRSAHGGSGSVIAHVVHTYLPRSATFIYTTLRSLKEFRPVVLAGRTANLNEFPFTPVVELVPSASLPARVIRRTTALLRGFGATLDYGIAREAGAFDSVALHAHFGWAGCASLGAQRRLRIPLVTTFYGRDISQRRGCRYEALFADATLFTCEGPYMAANLEGIGCPREKIRLVKIGLDLERFPFIPRSRSTPLVVMQVARLVEKKGVDLSIRAYAAAKPRLGPSELWIVGDGELRRDLEALASRLGISDAVRFTGMVSHAEYRRAAGRADICIQPSRTAADGDTEGGAPVVLLEMQAIGTPVVATRHADIPSVVADPAELLEEEDVAGLAEALVRVAEFSGEERMAHVARGRALVESQHDTRVLARETERVYIEAIRLMNGQHMETDP